MFRYQASLLKKVRKEFLKVSKTEIAEILKVTPQYVWNIENAKAGIPLRRVRKLSEASGVSLKTFEVAYLADQRDYFRKQTK